MSAELRPLLRDIRKIPPYGPEGYGTMAPDHQERVFRQMEDVQAGFEADIWGRLQDGFPDLHEKIRTSMLGGISLLSVAYSAGSSNGELPTRELISMAALTAITGVANRLIDYGDPSMRSATLRWCKTPLESERAWSEKEETRLNFMQGIEEIIPIIASPKDYDVTLAVIRELMAANVDAHDLTMEWNKARQAGKNQEAEFWELRTSNVARTLLKTGAMQSLTIPLEAMYHKQDTDVPSASETWGDQSTQALFEAANFDIRKHDDVGDSERDARPEKMSINVINESLSVHGATLIHELCTQAGITDHDTRDQLTLAIRSIRTAERGGGAKQIIGKISEQNVHKAKQNVPEVHNLHTKLVTRGLAAGRVNARGDDAL